MLIDSKEDLAVKIILSRTNSAYFTGIILEE